MKNFKSLIITVLCASFVFSGCGNASRTAIGAGIGIAAGAGAGAGIGKAAGNVAVGTAIGAVVGGVAGVLIGRHMDKQKEELEAVLPDNTSIVTVNDGEAIKVTFESGILFAVNSTNISEASQKALTDFASNLKENADTDVTIVGHTDITGTVEYNQELSERRAQGVYDYLNKAGIKANRMTTVGKGIHEPIADNNTVEGRLQNRRVEIFITANEDMIKAAQKEADQKAE